MHPVQNQLSKQAGELIEKLAAKNSGKKQQAASPMLWKYTDAEGHRFWLEEKRMTVRSPYSGKSFSAKPERETPSSVGQDLREEAAMGAGPGPKVQTKRKKMADDEWKATSFEVPESEPTTDG
jgi:hypothetical protein